MKKTIIVILAFFSFLASQAQDRYFAQTYTTDILGKGAVDMELWHTSRIGHASGFYHGMDQRMELEVGLGKNWQTAFYFNRFQEMESDSAGNIQNESEIGFSNEWKYRISKPGAKFGVALYSELGVKGDEVELETKLILDRAFGKNLFAFNLVYEIEEEIEKEKDKFRLHTSETPVELDLGYLRYVNPNLGLGIELRNNNLITDGHWKNSVLFGGPTINYRGGKWFVIANFLPQWVNLRKTSFSPGKRVLDTREKSEARIIFGISL